MEVFTSQKTVTAVKRQVYTGDKSTVTTVSSALPVPPASLVSGLIECWGFDLAGTYDDYGQVNGWSMQEYADVQNAQIVRVPGKLAMCADLNLANREHFTNNDWSTVPPKSANQDSFSAFLWVKFKSLDTDDGWSQLFGHWDEPSNNRSWVIYSQSNGTELVVEHSTVGNNSSENLLITLTEPFVVGEWYHIGLTFDYTTATYTVYLNGVAIGSKVVADPNYYESQSGYRVGAFYTTGGGTGGGLDAYIDQHILYRRALTQEEVTALWNDGNGLWYPFDSYAPMNRSVLLDGTSQTFYAESFVNPTSMNISGDITFEFWWKPTAMPTPYSNDKVVFLDRWGIPWNQKGFYFALKEWGGNYLWEMGYSMDGSNEFQAQGATTTQLGVPLNEWVHVSYVYNQIVGNAIVYLNGVQEAILTPLTGQNTPAFQSTLNPHVGGGPYWGGINTYVPGNLFEMRMYSYAKSQAQVEAGMNTLEDGTGAGVVFAVSFNGTLRDSAPDWYDMIAITNNVPPYVLDAPFGNTPPADYTYTCYLRPLNEEQSASNGVQFGLGFNIITECEVDIREGDHVTIDGVTYTIRGVVNHDRGIATRYKRALALKQENQ